MSDSLPIVYMDDAIVVVDKPFGIATQPGRPVRGRHQPKRAPDSLLDRVQAQVGNVYLHHRLDQPASGLVLFSRAKAANKPLARMFREHSIERSYLAFVSGLASDQVWEGAVDGKDAQSECRLLGHGPEMSFVELTLTTGRKHQLRVHAANHGFPLLGDRRYGGLAGRLWPRLALHAAHLGFAHPLTGERLLLTSDLPEDLADLLDWIEGDIVPPRWF